jgi:trypsin
MKLNTRVTRWASIAFAGTLLTAMLPLGMSGPAFAGTTTPAPKTSTTPTVTTPTVPVSPVPVEDSIVTPNIVGGTDATIGDAPWQVGLIFANAGDEWNGQFCGGSIIAAQWIATAAHCVTGSSPSSIRILAGQATLSMASNTRAVAVSNIYVHPQYGYSGDEDDIALIKLSAPLTLVAGSVQKIDLPSGAPNVASTELITGWGDQASGSGNYPTVMRKAQVSVMNDSVCASAYGGGYSAAKMVCAANPTYTIDTCQGDSGGPLARNTGATWVLEGITSFGNGCAVFGYPGVYTEVFNYRSWINGYVNPVANAFTNSVAPSITGTKRAGKTLTANVGEWSPTPTSYTYRWLSSATKNGNYAPISGATSKTYLLKTSDRNKFIKVEVTAIKSGYTSSKATSARTAAIG